VREALAVWSPVWVVDDASTDGSVQALAALVAESGGALRVLRRERNGGKGAAVLEAAEQALAEGFTEALVLDADGQHPADRIIEFMGRSAAAPGTLIAGVPVFGEEAPRIRLYGRKLSVGLVWCELGGGAVKDPLFGFRVYPLAALVRAMHSTRWARRYDFDPEVAVRMVWAGVPTENVPAACRYISREEGGVSHFHYLRDNVRMVALHTRLIAELVLYQGWVRGFSKNGTGLGA